MSSKEPRWRVMCDEARGKPRCLIVDQDGNEVAAVNPYREAWNENSELIARAPELLADNARLRELLRRAAPFVPVENPLTPDLRKELDK